MNHQANHGVEPEKAQGERKSAPSDFISPLPKKYWMRLQPSKATKATSFASAYLDAQRRNKRLFSFLALFLLRGMTYSILFKTHPTWRNITSVWDFTCYLALRIVLRYMNLTTITSHSYFL